MARSRRGREVAACSRREGPRAVPYLRPILSVPLLTSARKGEALGLEVGDIDLEREQVHIRANRWRTLKTKRSRRTVPLWPQLRDILSDYMQAFGRTEGLLFPAKHGGMLDDLRGSLSAVVAAADLDKRVGFTTLRHTYAATRIQTLDHGQPVSLYTVAREMGHGGVHLIEQTYGHLQATRYRSPVVEYVEAEVVPLAEHRAAEGA